MYNKRLNSLMSLATKPTVSVEDAEPEVVTQPAEGNPQTETQQAVLTDQAQAEAARAVEENQVPADGNIPASDTNAAATQAVSQEQQSTVEQAPVATETNPGNPNAKDGDGSGTEPATPADAAVSDPEPTNDGTNTTPASPAAVADVQDPAKAQPTFEAPPAAVAAANQAPPAEGDANNPSEMPDSLPNDDKTDLSELKPNTVNAVGNEDLTPEDLAAVKDVVQEVVAAEPAATDVPSPAVGDTPVSEPAVAEATTDAPPTEGAVDAPAVTEGEPAVAPAEAVQEAAQAAADIIANAGENAPEAAQAVDAVADAAVAAANGDDVTPAGAVAAQDALDNTEAGVSAVEAGEAGQGEVDILNDELIELDEASDELAASTESLVVIALALENLTEQVETSLGNGGLSDDAAGILSTSVNALADQAGVDEPTLGLESITYGDRVIATTYGIEQLRAVSTNVEQRLAVSTEGLFDLFRGFTAKTGKWADAFAKELSDVKAKVGEGSGTVKMSCHNKNDVAAEVSKAVRLSQPVMISFTDSLMGIAAQMDNTDAFVKIPEVPGLTQSASGLDYNRSILSNNDIRATAPLMADARLVAMTSKKDGTTTYDDYIDSNPIGGEFSTTGKDVNNTIVELEKAVDLVRNFVKRREALASKLNGVKGARARALANAIDATTKMHRVLTFVMNESLRYVKAASRAIK